MLPLPFLEKHLTKYIGLYTFETKTLFKLRMWITHFFLKDALTYRTIPGHTAHVCDWSDQLWVRPVLCLCLRSAVGMAGATPLCLPGSSFPPTSTASSLSNMLTSFGIVHTDVPLRWNFTTDRGGRNQGRPVLALMIPCLSPHSCHYKHEHQNWDKVEADFLYTLNNLKGNQIIIM